MKKRPGTPSPVSSALARIVRRHRRVLAAGLTFAAVFGALGALSPPSPDLVQVVVATQDLPAGTRLTGGHLAVRTLPPDAAPSQVITDAEAVTGRLLAGPVTRGSVLTNASVATGSRLASPGNVVVPVRLPDPAIASLVAPGSLVDVWGADGAVVVEGARVVAAPEPGSSGGLGSLSSSSAALLDVPPAVATRLATMPSGELTIAVR